MSPPARKRQRAIDTDISMDEFTNPRLLSNLLTKNPLMSFSATPSEKSSPYAYFVLAIYMEMFGTGWVGLVRRQYHTR